MNEDQDIVSRLKDMSSGLVPRSEADVMLEAAKTIERLRKMLLAEENAYDILRMDHEHVSKDRNNLELRLKDVKEGFEGCCTTCESVGLMNKKLLRERDSLRREVCESRASCIKGKKATDIASALGWDCFEEPR